MNIEFSQGSFWPVDPRFFPVSGFDEAGQPRALTFGAGGLQVALAEDQVIAAGGVTVLAGASFERPADTTAYAAHDAVSDSVADPQPLVLPNVARVAGGGGIILSARLTLGAASAAGIAFRVWLLTQAGTPAADNAPYPLALADEAARIGCIDFLPETEGSGSDCATAVVTGLNLPYRAAPGSRDLYAAVVVKAAYTPVSAMAVSLCVGIAND